MYLSMYHVCMYVYVYVYVCVSLKLLTDCLSCQLPLDMALLLVLDTWATWQNISQLFSILEAHTAAAQQFKQSRSIDKGV